jgi:release factor glutamine methyltransferase
VAALDLSAAALKVAARNGHRHTDGRVAFVQGNLLDAVSGPIDVIISNPPYVPSGSRLAPDVGKFEPHQALYAQDDGLAILQRLIVDARARLAAGGLFVVEFGFGQDSPVTDLAHAAGWRDVTIREDLQGIPRVAIMRSEQ